MVGSQGRKQTSGGDPRIGTFHQMWVTAGDIACSVNGALGNHPQGNSPISGKSKFS